MAWRSDKFRFWLPVVVLAGAVAGLATRLTILHFGFVKLEKKPTYKFTKYPAAPRGGIYSSSGVPFACTKTVWEYHVDPKVANEDPRHPGQPVSASARWTNITNLSTSLDIPLRKVMDAYARRDSRFVYLATSDDDGAHGKVSGIHELSVNEKQVRVYPQGRQLSQVLGFVSRDPTNRVGGAGIELKYERFLKGMSGRVSGVKNAHGHELRALRQEDKALESKPGCDVYLTVDHNIQYEVEKILAAGLVRHQAERVWAIVLQVRTGAVLAMATLPDFDPGDFPSSTREQRMNRAISESYEPGSVMKTITACAVINERMVSPKTMVNTDRKDSRYYRLPGDGSHTWEPFMSVTEALVHSSNIVFGKLGFDLGPQRLWTYMDAFGLGHKTGIELPGEETGILPDWKKWDKVKWSRAPIGQGVAVTAIQLATAYACIGNDGELLKPYIVERIEERDDDGNSESKNVVYQHQRQVVGHPIRAETARTVRAMMLGVAKKGGTARKAAVPGYTIAGKTGTAQMQEGRGYSENNFHASFIGIVPASRPEVVILVTYQKPTVCRRRDTSEAKGIPVFNHQGGVCAGPTFSEIATFVLRYLAVEPDVPEEVPEDDEV